VQVPCARESCPEALASCKGAPGDRRSEGSKTAKSGTDEQELHMRLIKLDEQAHLCDVQTPKGEYFISRCSGNRRKEDALTWGGLFVFFL
jgi:hypothetical protein